MGCSVHDVHCLEISHPFGRPRSPQAACWSCSCSQPPARSCSPRSRRPQSSCKSSAWMYACQSPPKHTIGTVVCPPLALSLSFREALNVLQASRSDMFARSTGLQFAMQRRPSLAGASYQPQPSHEMQDVSSLPAPGERSRPEFLEAQPGNANPAIQVLLRILSTHRLQDILFHSWPENSWLDPDPMDLLCARSPFACAAPQGISYHASCPHTKAVPTGGGFSAGSCFFSVVSSLLGSACWLCMDEPE